MNKVAVYGSLRKDLHNHRVLGDSVMLGEDRLTNFSMYSLSAYPFVTPSDNDNDSIAVEVYEVSPTTFEALDRLEGYPTFYDRKEVDTNQGKAWIYFMEDRSGYEDTSKVSSGDWKSYYYS